MRQASQEPLCQICLRNGHLKEPLLDNIVEPFSWAEPVASAERPLWPSADAMSRHSARLQSASETPILTTVLEDTRHGIARRDIMLRTHGRYAYSNITKRPDYSWPDGKRLAVYMAVNAVTHAWRRNPRTQHHQLRGAGHLDEAAEAELIRTVTETIERHEGQRPVGWM